jgi:hypothetical protein
MRNRQVGRHDSNAQLRGGQLAHAPPMFCTRTITYSTRMLAGIATRVAPNQRTGASTCSASTPSPTSTRAPSPACRATSRSSSRRTSSASSRTSRGRRSRRRRS